MDHFPGVVSKISLYDLEWNKLPVKYGSHPEIVKTIAKPKHFDKMIEVAKELSKDFPFVRVDFYDLENTLYVGEMTFYPGGGYNSYSPFEWNYKLGEFLDLDKIENKYLVRNIPKTLVAVERNK